MQNFEHRREKKEMKIFLTILDQTLLFFTRNINLLRLYIINHYNYNDSVYQFLTANDNAENIIVHTKALDDALENKKVKNIAISGSYGSGKSSFIKTFEKNHPQYNFLDISLATFKSQNTKENEKLTDLSLIEKSILEQMFYKVKNTTIPQSRLKKINRLTWLPIKIITILIIALSYFILLAPEKIEKIALLKALVQTISENSLEYLPLIILLLGSYWIIKKVLIIISNSIIEKINLKNLELISNSDSASLLNKYLDEILYFFEKTNFHIVVFQDLDRFGNLEIFTKLRELNNFINNSEQVGKRIVFLYAVQDNMFKNAYERTKFFDFLIPIIPYINATNSKDILFNYFQDITKSFLYDISLYISDMRLLKNIYNEYLIYSKNLDGKLDKTKLLAMIIYKNFEPQDFEELHKCKGLVYDVFKRKMEYLKSYNHTIEQEITNIQTNIQEIEKEPLNDIKELRELYILQIINQFNGSFDGKLYCSDKIFTIQDSVLDDNFELIKKSDRIISKFYPRNDYSLKDSNAVNFKHIENILKSYEEREKTILDKINNKRDYLELEIEKLKNQQQLLKDVSIKELFEQFNNVTILDAIDDNEEKNKRDFYNKDLMKYLLSYGHIDENYEEYISNFFGISITKDEQEFLRNIKNNGEVLSFNYELKHLEEIVTFRLTVNEFNKESVLNLYIIDYLLENKNSYSEQIEKLFQQLSNQSELSKEFILHCLDTCREKVEFVRLIVKYNQNFWLFLTDKRNDKLNTYFGWIIYYAESKDIIKLNINNTLKEYLIQAEYLQPFTGNEVKKVINIIKYFNIKFFRLNLVDNFQIVEFIFRKSHYALSPDMINQMLFYKCAPKTEVEEHLKVAHLTTIKSDKMHTDQDILLQYIYDNINEYIENVFLKISTNTQESEEIIIELLNIENLNVDLKYRIIETQENKIIEINHIDRSLWETLIRYNKINPSWDNAFKYFNDNDTNNDLLLNYLNIEENAKTISQINCGGEYQKKHEFFNQELLRFIIQTNIFSLTSYEYLTKNLGYVYLDLNISELDKNKILLLIKYNKFQFKKQCFDTLKARNDILHIALIEKNKEKLLEEFENFQFDTDDITQILDMNNNTISPDIKKNLIEKIDYTLINNAKIAKLIYQYIDKTMKKPFDYVKIMLQNLKNLESRVNLIVEQNNGLDEKEFFEILDFLPVEYSKIKNLDGKETILTDTDYNQKLIKILKEKEFITSAKKEKKDQLRLYIKKR